MSKYTHFTLSIFLLLFASSLLTGQKLDQELVDKANVLSKSYEDDELILTSSNSTYSFFIDKKSEELMVKRVDQQKYLALKNNVAYTRKIAYNDNCYIESYSIKSDNNKAYDHKKACGHYQSGEIFYSDAQFCAYNFEFNHKGRGIIFESEFIYKDPKYLTQVFFHDDIPTLQREISIEIPEGVNVELLEMNFSGYDVTSFSNNNGIQKYTYKMKEVEDAEPPKNSPGRLHYLPHILIITKSYYKNGENKNLLSSTDDLYNWYRSLTLLLNEDLDVISQKAKELTAGLSSNEAKIEAIYYWVQDNIKYIAFENGIAGFKPDEAYKVYYNKYGDCKGMANLIKNMLISLGYDARLGWLGTTRIPYTYDIPSLAVDNHMVCTVDIDGKRYILDGTEKFNALGYNAERIQGKQLMIENGDKYFIETINEESIDNYLTISKIKYEIKDEILYADGSVELNGEQKKLYYYLLDSQKKDKIEDVLKVAINGMNSPDQFKIKEYTNIDRRKPLSITYNAELKAHLNKFGNEYYLDIDFAEELKGLDIEEDRDVPFYFGEKMNSKTVSELVIPHDLEIEYLPPGFSTSNEYYSIDFKYKIEGQKVFYTKQIQIFKTILPKSQFGNWNSTIKEVNKFYNDQIILKAAD